MNPEHERIVQEGNVIEQDSPINVTACT